MKKKHIVGTVLFTLVFLAASTYAIAAGAYHRIDGAGLQEMMTDGEELVIVDVREPWLYVRGHIPGAINIPFDGARERVSTELDPDDRIVFVCHGGPMGDELGAHLASRGYGRVYNLKGGMNRWRGPTER